MAVFPPAPNTFSGDNLTASRFANSTQMLARALLDLGTQRYIGNLLLPQRVTTMSGSINYESPGEGITAADTPTQVAPGAEYQLTGVSYGTPNTASVGKWGQDTILSDEAVARFAFPAINKALTKLSNSAKLLIDAAVLTAINAAATYTTAATAKWDGSGSTPKVLLDVQKARAAMRGLNLGYDPNTLVIDDTVWAYLSADTTLQAAMARESRENSVYTGRFEALAGLEIIPVPASHLPGGVNTSAFLLDRNQAGFILTEDIGGGYVSAGDLVELKSWRPEGIDGVRIRARSIFKAVVTDPGAIYKITTVI